MLIICYSPCCLAGRLIGELNGGKTKFLLTDALGSAAVLGNQVYGPYGSAQYQKGAMGTSKGFIGQYNDGSGLDYFHARYYDPVVGVFLTQRLNSRALIDDLLTPFIIQ